eukprot:m.116435 g.116435  ORF g.116435 m.116435 type:complete len:296 (-) comp15401_c0_seq3:647-1534(-)
MTDRYVLEKKLGRGTYGEVFKAKDTITQRSVAIKAMDIFEPGVPCFMLREISMLVSLRYSKIVELLDIHYIAGESSRTMYLVFEYMPRDLAYHLEQTTSISHDLAQSYMLQLLLGLAYMHERGFIHRDLKPGNLLIDAEGNLKIADFGLSRPRLFKDAYTPEMVTLWYRPPEILLGAEDYTEEADMWSAGCIFAEMLQSSPLFKGDSTVPMIHSITSQLGTPTAAVWPALPSLPHEDLISGAVQRYPLRPLSATGRFSKDDGYILDAMLRFNPSLRMCARDAAALPVFDPYREFP